MTLIVVSTGLSHPTKARCIESVESQECPDPWARRFKDLWRHVYVEASEQVPRLGATENFRRIVMGLDPKDIVVCLDGDDWLAHDNVLAKVEAMHAGGAWVTYGSFVSAAGPPGNGQPGFVRKYPSTDYRREPWLASHLKTFRAGLYQRIKEEDMKVDGEWCFAQDHAMMFPILEMAGPSRTRFCPDVLYVYNWSTSNWVTGDREKEQAHAAAIRQKPRYVELPEWGHP